VLREQKHRYGQYATDNKCSSPHELSKSDAGIRLPAALIFACHKDGFKEP